MIPIPIPPDAQSNAILPAVEQAIASVGLHIVLRGALKKHAGSTHWHLKYNNQRGTLEMTYLPVEPRAWFAIQSRRDAGWIDAKIEALLKDLSKRL